MSESNEQAAVVKWWRLQYPQYAKLLIPSQSGVMIGGKNKFGIISKQKKEGWISGVPDIQITIARGGFHGLFIEMKDVGKKENSLSQDQIDYLSELGAQGYMTVWCAGADSAIETIKGYMKC